jgi:hypothetical protein
LLSCDFPFVGGWHELSGCYKGIGWQVHDRTVEVRQGDKDKPYDLALLTMTKPDGRSSLVAFCGCTSDGATLEAPALTLIESFWNAFARREAYADARQSYQVQVLTERSDEISDADREVARQLVDEARKRFAAVAKKL